MTTRSNARTLTWSIEHAVKADRAVKTARAVAGSTAVCDGVPEAIDEAPTIQVLPFANRYEAGRLLGRSLVQHTRPNAVVLGIGHSGMAVAQGVARELGLELDLWLKTKVRSPIDPTLVLCVVSEAATFVLDREALVRPEMSTPQVRALVQDTSEELAAHATHLRGARLPADLGGKTTILVDDGISSGSTLSAAIEGARRRGAARVVVAAPVGAQPALACLAAEADAVVCLLTPLRVRRVGAWYRDYRPVSDQAVMNMLAAPGR